MRALAKWHRRLGLFAALLVVFVTVTGFLLQYAPALGLNRAMVHDRTLLSLYVGKQEAPALVLRTAHGEQVWRKGLLYTANTKPLPIETPPVGAVPTAGGTVIATADSLYVISADGGLLERIDASLLPGPVTAIGQTAAGALALNTGGRFYVTDASFSAFTPTEDAVAWSRPQTATPDALPDFVARAEPVALPWDRILLDLHTGRLFGTAGVWIVNLGSLAFLLLAISGVVTALRRNGRSNGNGNGHH
jgi:hypothetical protein